MTEAFKIVGTLLLNTNQAEDAMDKTSKRADGFADGLGKKFMKLATIVGTALAVDKLKDFGMACAQTYADISAQQSAFAQTMGDYADSAQKKLDGVAEKTGVVSSRLTPYMTSMTAKFKGLGYGVDEATTLATEGLELASDAAAFWDRSLDDSMSHLNSFLNGSYEGGEAIGLFANDTQMAAYAVEKGIVADAKAWAQLDEATKQSTRLQFAKDMYAQAGMTGQAAKEADSYANSMANLQEMWKQFQATIGKPILEKIILPCMNKLTKIMPRLQEGLEGVVDGFSKWLDDIGANFEGVFGDDGSIDFEKLGEAISGMFADLGKSVPKLLSKLGDAIAWAWENAVYPMIQGLFKATFGVDLPEWSVVWAEIKNWWDTWIAPVVSEIGKVFMTIVTPDFDDDGTSWADRISTWLNNILDSIVDLGAVVMKMIFPQTDENGVSYVDKVAEWLKGAADKAFELIASVFSITELFMPNEEDDGSTAATRIADWFNRVMNALGNALLIPIELIMPDFAETMRKWFGLKDRKENEQSYVDASYDMSTPYALKLAGKYAHWSPEQKEAAYEYADWMSAGDLVEANKHLDTLIAISPDEDAVGEFVADVQTALNEGDYGIVIADTWFDETTESQLQAQLDALGLSVPVEYIVGTYTGAYNADGQADGSHAKGLDRVPFDGYKAILHKDEAVLNAAQAAAWRGGGMGADVGRLEAAINGLQGLLLQIASNTGRNQTVMLDSGVLVGQMIPAMDAGLGSIAVRKGRGNG